MLSPLILCTLPDEDICPANSLALPGFAFNWTKMGSSVRCNNSAIVPQASSTPFFKMAMRSARASTSFRECEDISEVVPDRLRVSISW